MALRLHRQSSCWEELPENAQEVDVKLDPHLKTRFQNVSVNRWSMRIYVFRERLERIERIFSEATRQVVQLQELYLKKKMVVNVLFFFFT